MAMSIFSFPHLAHVVLEENVLHTPHGVVLHHRHHLRLQANHTPNISSGSKKT